MTITQAMASGVFGPVTPVPQVIEVDRTITLGYGTDQQVVREFGMQLVGKGNGPGPAEMSPWGGATVLRWVGPPGGTVVKVAGPIAACEVGKFTIDCNGVAGVGLELAHPYASYIHDILVVNPTRLGVWLHGVGSAAGRSVTNNAVCVNACQNTLERIRVQLVQPNSTGWEVGVNDDNVTFGVSQNMFVHCGTAGTRLDSQVGWRFRGCDSNWFVFPYGFEVGEPWRYEAPTQAQYPGEFPYALHCTMPFLWPTPKPYGQIQSPAVTWSPNWNPHNVTVMDMPIREWAGGDVYYPAVVERPDNPRAIVWQGLREKEKEG